MFIFIVRHAWAYEFGDPRWPDDSQRELEPEGADRYMSVVQTLAGRGFAPNKIATSPYVRCKQTAQIISDYSLHEPKIDELEALEPGSDLESLLQWSNQADCDQLCWVGHAPDVGNLTAALVGDSSAGIRFAKGAVAAIRFEDRIQAGDGQLYWHVTAKSLGL